MLEWYFTIYLIRNQDYSILIHLQLRSIYVYAKYKTISEQYHRAEENCQARPLLAIKSDCDPATPTTMQQLRKYKAGRIPPI